MRKLYKKCSFLLDILLFIPIFVLLKIENMKKLILLVVTTLFVNLNAFSQNMVGESWSDVAKTMYQKGYIVNSDVTSDEKIPYITASSDGVVRIYYFTKNNQCYLYALAIEDATFEFLEKSLLDGDYKKRGNMYYNDQYMAEIVLLGKENAYVLKFSFK